MEVSDTPDVFREGIKKIDNDFMLESLNQLYTNDLKEK
jgi:hypothetical protein